MTEKEEIKSVDLIRVARRSDLESIVAIYNQATQAKFETAHTEEFSATDRLDWFNQHDENSYPIYVYEKNSNVIGWVSLSAYRPGREALRYTVEISYYVRLDFKRQGIGTKLVMYAINKSRELNLKTILAVVLNKNVASIEFLTKLGFSKWGDLPGVADFNGVECDHVYYGLRLK